MAIAADPLVELYRSAYLSILERIAMKEARGSLTTYERQLLADIARILLDLDVATSEWIEDQFPRVYLNGQTEAIRELISMGAVPQGMQASFAGVHISAAQTLADSLSADLTLARETVGRRVEDLFRDAGLEAVARKVATGQTMPEARKALRQQLAEQGVSGFTDAAGRRWRLDAYAEMVVRSTTREATNLGRLNQQRELGFDLVKMTVHHPTCSICAVYQGRVYSVSGTDERYPSLYGTVLSRGYHTVHPNCGHSFAPYVERLAEDADGDREASSKPFDADPRTEAQRRAYSRATERKRLALADRRQWERYRAVLPDDTPSLAGFRRMKAANSARYQELQQLYREINQLTA